MTDFTDIRLGDLAHAVRVTKGFPTQRALPQGDIPVMSIAGIRNQSPPRHFASSSDIEDLRIDLALPGDILVSIEGGTVGESLAVQSDVVEFVPSQQAATLRVIDTRTLDPWYLAAWLSTEPGREQLERLARGMGIQRIPVKELSSLVIKMPPPEEQHEIGQRFIAFERAIRSHRSVSACLEELRDADLVVTFANASLGVSPEPSANKKGTSHGR